MSHCVDHADAPVAAQAALHFEKVCAPPGCPSLRSPPRPFTAAHRAGRHRVERSDLSLALLRATCRRLEAAAAFLKAALKTLPLSDEYSAKKQERVAKKTTGRITAAAKKIVAKAP